eukprot:snap_masked-scaffold619_size123246-processed-gene-0.4 protein:Tk05495 transcript:snap_masked-scaffold619_size123246-processed-gene-0.4-mRNA-1 annotation:"ubiquitin domain-containing protein 2-like"
MGNCLGLNRDLDPHGEAPSGGALSSRRGSTFSDSTSSAIHTQKNRPLRHEKIRWKSDIPLTEGQLKSKRDEFWDTAPAFDGKLEIWNALKAAAEASEAHNDFDLAQAILDGAGISLPHGSLVEGYDELGTRYVIPVYCLSYPVNLLNESDRDSPDEASEPVYDPEAGREVRLRLRVSITGTEIRFYANTAETILSAKRKLQTHSEARVGEPARQRWFYGGRLLNDKTRVGDARVPSGHVIQCIVSELDFDVIPSGGPSATTADGRKRSKKD